VINSVLFWLLGNISGTFLIVTLAFDDSKFVTAHKLRHNANNPKESG
jgi:hypothetical protein